MFYNPVDIKNFCLTGAQLLEWSSRICRSSGKDLDTGRHEKAQVRCPYSQSAAFHGAPQTLPLLL